MDGGTRIAWTEKRDRIQFALHGREELSIAHDIAKSHVPRDQQPGSRATC
jgi:hypothetical protein